MAIASLRGLSHRHWGAPRPSVADIDLEVQPGELMLVTGASGSGKSTLLRVFNGLVPHFHGGRIAGAATVAGQDVLRTPTRELAASVGMVFQDCETQLIGGSVEGELVFGMENLGVAPAEMPERMERALAACGIAHLRRRSVATLSGGERQRLAIACTVALDQPLLVLDEPTAQLDHEGAQAVLHLCLQRARDGVAVVLAEHRLELVLPEAGRLLLLDQGRAQGPGAPRALARRLAAPPQAVELAVRAGWDWTPLSVAELHGRVPEPPALAPPPRRRGGSAVWALRDAVIGLQRRPLLQVDALEGHAGEVTVLMGPNGGGKTTLLRSLAGFVPLLSGTCEMRPGRRAYLPQDPAAVLHQPTVAAEVQWTLRHAGGGDDALLDDLGLRAHAQRHPRDLSSGERQRAAVAALLSGAPTLALLDEPTRGMDAQARDGLVHAVRRLATHGCAVVLATHDSTLAAELADQVVDVRDGTVRELGPPRRALSGGSPYATELGRRRFCGPVTVEETLAHLRHDQPLQLSAP